MTWNIILQIILLGIALAMDVLAVSVTNGLTCSNINKRRGIFIAFVFGFMQALMPLLGYWLVEGISVWVGEAGGKEAGKIMGIVVTWIAFALLLFIGGKMLIDGIKELRNKNKEIHCKLFSIKTIIIYGFATSIDALGAGVALHSSWSNNSTIWLHVSIIMVISFVVSLLGTFLGKNIEKLLKGKYEITSIIGGCILIALAIWVVVSHYTGI